MKVFFNQKQHDFPKRAGDLNLAWYASGQVCIVRKKVERALQKQNESIIRINRLCKALWDGLDPHFKRDLSRYALRYKSQYPGLRKRGISSYAVFLMIIHALIKRFSLTTEENEKSLALLRILLRDMSVCKAVRYRLLKVVSNYYQLNRSPNMDLPDNGKLVAYGTTIFLRYVAGQAAYLSVSPRWVAFGMSLDDRNLKIRPKWS